MGDVLVSLRLFPDMWGTRLLTPFGAVKYQVLGVCSRGVVSNKENQIDRFTRQGKEKLMSNKGRDYDPYNQGKFGVCQHCDDEGRLVWSDHFGCRVCVDCAGFSPFAF